MIFPSSPRLVVMQHPNPMSMPFIIKDPFSLWKKAKLQSSRPDHPQKYVITVLLENLGTKLKCKFFIGFGFKFAIGRTLCSFQKTIFGSPLLFCLKIFTCRPRTKSSGELLIVQNDYEIREIRRCNKHLSAKNVIWGLCMFGEFKALFSNVHCLSTLVVSW